MRKFLAAMAFVALIVVFLVCWFLTGISRMD